MKNDFYFALKTLFVLERGHPFSKYTKFSEKLTFLAPTRTCAYQGVRNVSVSENFAYVLYG